jgi:predicted 2-oxoglutarate/Fe(II)-dependent dioxygenase YbiX
MIYEIPNFLSHEFCDNVIEYFNVSGKRSLWQTDKKFHGRTLCPSEIDDNQLLNKFRAFEQKMVQTASKLFYEEQFIFSEFIDIVYWAPGMSMDEHVDNYDPDRGQNPATKQLPFRYYSSVCYLNDNYNGGYTFFPTENKACVPEKGKIVMFPSHIEHGVTEVKLNPRYTIAMWFTIHEDHIFNLI